MKTKYKIWDSINDEWFDETGILMAQDGTLKFWNMGKSEMETLDNDFTAVLWSGLKDKGGDDIYEGDIAYDDDNEYGKVTFSEGCFYFELNGAIEPLAECHDIIYVNDSLYQSPEFFL